MATYIGYFRFHADFLREKGEQARHGDDSLNVEFGQKVVDVRERLPHTIKLIAAYVPIGISLTHPGMWIVETDDPTELVFVNNYYDGWLDFEWVPARNVGSTSKDAAATVERVEALR